MSELLQYLRQVAEFSRQVRQVDSFEAYVLREGHLFGPCPLSADEMAYVLQISRGRKFPIKQCFYNSQMLLAADYERRMTYVEGFCAHAIVPVLHGWLAIGGKVVDTTMRMHPAARRRRRSRIALGDWTDRREYFGVEFSRQYVVQRMLARQAAGSLIDDFEGRWPLLRHPDGSNPGATTSVPRVPDGGGAVADFARERNLDDV